MSGTASKEQITETRDLLGFVGEPVQVCFEFGTVWAFSDVDNEEHAERIAKGIAPILSFELLAALSELPHRMPMRWESLDDHTRQALGDAPTGLIEHDGGIVQRIVRRPVRVGGAVATGRWVTASRHVGPLGTLCEVAVLTTQRPRVAGNPVLEAALYGQGLAWLKSNGTVELVQRPEPSLRVPGPYQWQLCETIYAAACDVVVNTEPTTA